MSGKNRKPAGSDADRKGRRFRSDRILGLLGALLLAAIAACCLPLTVPRLFGYHIYSVISGSMEPAVPVGSLLYIQEAVPEEVEEGDIIAYYGALDHASIITHRVVENRVVMGEFITKGDANQTEDVMPVPYGNLIGQVTLVVPGAGRAAELLTSSKGKLLAGGIIVAAILLQIISSVLRMYRTTF